MALTDYDREHLTNKQQQQIQIATTAYDKAKKIGDTAGMEKAAAKAAAVRNEAGYQTDSSGNYTGPYSPTTGSNTNTQTVSKPTTNSSLTTGAAALGATNTTSSNSGGTTPNTTNVNSQNSGYQYKIGSDAGQKIANNLPIYGTYTASDGSSWMKEKDGSISVFYKGDTTKNAYTMSDLGTLGQQQMAANLDWRQVQQTMEARQNKASTTAGLEDYAKDDIYWKMYDYVQKGQQAENAQNAINGYEGFVDDWNSNNAQPSYSGKYDAQIEAMLNEILNRDDFSYDVANDPLYQQYANMYRREGDRAMRETLAEAAAGAGGMNTYAVTAAQQANNYYNSQLNDKIPELYQLAYEMYLNDKESQIQDLGLLQSMDATQYNRYRDTMTDWYNDRNFAYGVYNDAVQQGNWQKVYDNDNYWKSKEFENNNYWNQTYLDNENFWNRTYLDNDNKWKQTYLDNDNYWAEKNFNNENYWNQTYLDNDNYWAEKEFNNNNYWAEKEFGANQAQTDYEKGIYTQETAKEEVWKYIKLGVTPSADLIAKAGMTDTDVALAVAAVKAEQGGTSSSKRTYDYDDEQDKLEDDDVDDTDDKESGTIPASEIAGILTRDEWERRKSSHEVYGQGNVAVSEYDTYEAYRNAMMDYLKQKYSNG